MKNIFSFLCFLFIGNLHSQQFNTAKLDSFLNLLEKENQAMGSVAISQNGKIIYQKGIGFGDNPSNSSPQINENSRFRVGSVSKMFTAVLIFQLIEAKKLSLDTKLSKFFKTIPNSKKITIAHLLQHRSGIFNFTNDEKYLEMAYKPISEEDLVKHIAAYPADFQPDTKADYSNSNYVLLGLIVEKLYKKPFAEVLKTQICDKIGLKNTYIGSKIDVTKNEVHSFARVENWEKSPETDMSVPRGAGAVVATPADLLIFIDALFAEKLVNKAHLEKMKTLKDGYGMAMFQTPFYDKKGWGHTGGLDEFSSVLSYFEQEKIAVAYCSNGASYGFNDVLIGILSICFDKKYELPSFKEVEISEEELKSCEGLYSSKNFPLKISLTRRGKKLFAQATGQGEFPLTAAGDNVFKFDAANIVIKMKDDKSGFNFKQNGQTFDFEKEK